MQRVFVAGAGMTRIGRRSEPLPELMADAARVALDEAGLEAPDAIVVATMNPEEFLGEGNFASSVATHMGFADVPCLRIETATSSGAAAFYAGFAQVAAGLRRTVLVVGGEKMTHLATPRVSEIIGRSIDPYERAYGATMPALAGLVTRALMSSQGTTAREIGQVAVKNHANGMRNALAHFQRAVTLEEVLESRMVADPLRLLHCCPISDGAAAVVLTADRDRVRVAGVGHGTDTLAVRHRRELTTFAATRAAAREATRWPASARSAWTWRRSTTPSRPSSSSRSRTSACCRRARRGGRPSTATRRWKGGCRSIPPAGSRRAATRWRRRASPRSWSACGS